MPHFAWTRGSKLWPWLYYGVQRSARVVCWVVLTLLFVCWKGCNCHQLCDVVRVVSISLTIVSMWHAHNCYSLSPPFSVTYTKRQKHARARANTHTHNMPPFATETLLLMYFQDRLLRGRKKLQDVGSCLSPRCCPDVLKVHVTGIFMRWWGGRSAR